MRRLATPYTGHRGTESRHTHTHFKESEFIMFFWAKKPRHASEYLLSQCPKMTVVTPVKINLGDNGFTVQNGSVRCAELFVFRLFKCHAFCTS